MKRCPTCNRTYTDPQLSFCIDDGTPLTTEVEEDEPYRPPAAYVPPGTMPPAKQRRAWPWVVGILGAFFLAGIVLTIVAAIFIPRMVRSRQGAAPVVNVNRGETDKTDQTETVESPAPTDEQRVLAQLTEIEHDWTVANLNADKKALDRILADEYVGPRAPPLGGLQGKKEYIETIEPEPEVERWEFNDLKVQLSGDRATLTGKITYVTAQNQGTFEFVDKFVWRDGRWQATGAELKRSE
jgi:hypothetical protein